MAGRKVRVAAAGLETRRELEGSPLAPARILRRGRGGLGGTLWLAVERRENTPPSPAEAAETVRVQRLREDARRPISVNLAETIALSHALIEMAGAARR